MDNAFQGTTSWHITSNSTQQLTRPGFGPAAELP
jgi:hypothetical protein